QAAYTRDVDREVVGLGFLARDSEERDRDSPSGLPTRLDRRKLCRLMRQRIETMVVSNDDLQGHQNGEKPQRHRQHRAAFFDELSTPQQIRSDADHDEAGGDKESSDGVRKPGGKRRIENDL